MSYDFAILFCLAFAGCAIDHFTRGNYVPASALILAAATTAWIALSKIE